MTIRAVKNSCLLSVLFFTSQSLFAQENDDQPQSLETKPIKTSKQAKVTNRNLEKPFSKKDKNDFSLSSSNFGQSIKNLDKEIDPQVKSKDRAGLLTKKCSKNNEYIGERQKMVNVYNKSKYKQLEAPSHKDDYSQNPYYYTTKPSMELELDKNKDLCADEE